MGPTFSGGIISCLVLVLDIHDFEKQSQLVYHNDKDLYENIAQKGNKTLYFARSSQEGETWVYVIK